MYRLILWLIISLTLSLLSSLAIGANSQSVPVDTWNSGLIFIRENWAVVGLVLSELAAFLPPKFNGLLQVVISLVSAILSKKAKPATK